jgi:hypothetical protein
VDLVKRIYDFTLDRKIRAAGWNLFFIASEVKVMFFGAIRAKKIQQALHHRHFFSVAESRAGCGSVRGSPVFSSHFSPGLAPQVGHRAIRAVSFSAFITPSCTVAWHKAGQL